MNNENNLTFLMSGQGSQFPDMTNSFQEAFPFYRNKLNECLEILAKYDCNLMPIWKTDEINKTRNTQGALFAVEYAFACFWQHHGITPHLIIGHSIGEIVAATFSGVITLDQACELVAKRSKYMDDVNVDGSMLAVLSPKENWINSLPNSIDIALYNANEQTVLAGLTADIEQYANLLKSKKIRCMVLNVSHPFHSRYMQPCINEFLNAIKHISYMKTNIPIIGNVDHTIMKDYDAKYWARHIIEPVQFHQSIEYAYKLGSRLFLECGPQPTLSRIVKRTLPDDCTILYTNDKKSNPIDHINEIFSTLSKLGVPIKL